MGSQPQPQDQTDPFTATTQDKEPESPALLSGSYIDLSLESQVYSIGSHQSPQKSHTLKHRHSSTSAFVILSKSTILSEMEAVKQAFFEMRRKVEWCKALERAQRIKDCEGGMAGWERNCPFGDHVSFYDCITDENGVMRPRTEKKEALWEEQLKERLENDWEEELEKRMKEEEEKRRVEEAEMQVDCGRLADELANSKLEDEAAEFETAVGGFEEGWLPSDDDDDEDEWDPTTPGPCCFYPATIQINTPKPSPNDEPGAAQNKPETPKKSPLRKRVKRELGEKSASLVSMFESKEKEKSQRG